VAQSAAFGIRFLHRRVKRKPLWMLRVVARLLLVLAALSLPVASCRSDAAGNAVSDT
jgi:hypothetical protein